MKVINEERKQQRTIMHPNAIFGGYLFQFQLLSRTTKDKQKDKLDGVNIHTQHINRCNQ